MTKKEFDRLYAKFMTSVLTRQEREDLRKGLEEPRWAQRWERNFAMDMCRVGEAAARSPVRIFFP